MNKKEKKKERKNNKKFEDDSKTSERLLIIDLHWMKLAKLNLYVDAIVLFLFHFYNSP